jgi:hypothetical protein
VVTGVRTVVKPTVAAAVASTFSFPLVLMVFVFVFLLAQSRVDRLDPKLRTKSEADLGFEDEDRL